MIKLPARQVHLDFHTSEHIPRVGAMFNKQQFQAALKAGHINSITIFAKCHHSWSYYPTEVGRRHPTLKRDLMGEQIEACHEIGVRAPIYYTVGWSATDAERHPEWIARGRDGSPLVMNFDVNAGPEDKKPNGSWIFLCPSGGYKELMLEQTREICANYVVDGFFYDICAMAICHCANCTAGMRAAGLDPDDEAAAVQYDTIKWRQFMADCNEIIHHRHPDATIFYNGRADTTTPPELRDLQTHLELEDLPTAWGGYDKFPLRSKALANDGKQMLAMSGKFHTSWGEFGGFKHPDAIRFEAAAMIAFGARCSFGDQLHPSGEMDMATYNNIGVGYRYVKKIEQYGLDGVPFASLGLMLSGDGAHDQGVANMLLESQLDFEVVVPGTSLSRYEVIILTGGRRLDAESAVSLKEYIARGGAVLSLGESALEAGGDRVLLDVGARYLGPARYENDYTVVDRILAPRLVSSPFLNYIAAPRFKATNAEVLATIREPYFDRTYGHYCSHQNTPNQLKDAPHAAALQQGKVILLPHPLGQMYYTHGARLHRDFFINALKRLHKKPVIQTQLPSSGRVNLLHQPQRNRYVVHLLYSPPLQRGNYLVIEDMPPLRDVPLQVRVPEAIKEVQLPLSKQTLEVTRTGPVLRMTLPEWQAHQIVVLNY